jgi:hypothetical protein
VSDGASAPVGTSGGTSMTIKAGELEYGTQYAFTVVAINEHGAGSKSSPISGTVVPYTKPGRPGDVNATTVGDQKGAIRVSWAAPAENGRPITKYTVSGGGKSTEVPAGGTSATLTGFGDGTSVSVSVTAVNEAGASEAGTATAKTVAAPTVTITGGSATYNTATVNVSVNAGGGTATCTLSWSGKTSDGKCGSLKATGLKPSGVKYTLTVTAKNAAGSRSAARTLATANLYGKAACTDNKDSEDPAQRTYCDSDRPGRNGNEVFSKPDQGSTQVGWVNPRGNDTRKLVYCKKSGDNVDSYVYNNQKQSSWWLQISYGGKKAYIPWAWLDLENGDDIDAVATC